MKTKHETWDNNRIKHNNWNEKPEEFKLTHSLTVKNTTVEDVAKFKELKPVTVIPTVDGVPVAGPIEFSDPWFVDQFGNQPGGFNPYSTGLTGATLPKGGVFLNQEYIPGKPFYELRATQNATIAGLDGTFQNWSSSNENVTNPNNLETPVVFISPNDVVYANYDAYLTSKTVNWVQSSRAYSGNGTATIGYYSQTPTGTFDYWVHQEHNGTQKEIRINEFNGISPVSLAVTDYNRQKSYVGVFGPTDDLDKNLVITEIANGATTTRSSHFMGYIDGVVDGFSDQAKVFISPIINGNNWQSDPDCIALIVIDNLTVYSRYATINGTQFGTWSNWASFTTTSAAKVATNGRSFYLTWLNNGSLVGRRFRNQSWGQTYTLYPNSGGNFINFSATVNATDDLILMMTRYNSEEQIKSACYGKKYFNGNLSPLTVLENLINFGDYDAYSVASEGNKLLVSMGKRSKAETSCKYYLWKNDGTSWTKETTSFSSAPARLLHNEVDVRPYEFVTATTPALYALKTTPVTWPAGANMNKVGDENGFSIVAAQIGDTLNWYTTVSPEAVDSIVVDSTGIWSIVVNQVSAKNILISGLNRFGSAIWVDTSSTVLFLPATARYTFWVVDQAGNKMRYHKEESENEEAEFVPENKISVFPNPFNPTTVFSISVAEPSTVKLHIFNLIGQQIAEVVNADLNAGVHDYRLNAGSWSSGTYFYRLQIGEKTKTGKIQLVK